MAKLTLKSKKRSKVSNKTTPTRKGSRGKTAPGGGTVDEPKDFAMLLDVSPIQGPRKRGRKKKRETFRTPTRRLKANTLLDVQDDSFIVNNSHRQRQCSLSPTLERSFQTNLTFTRDRSESPLRQTIVPGELSKKSAWKKLGRDDKIRKIQESLVTRECRVKMAAGRKPELEKLQNFLTTHLRDGSGGSLYICGSPGTGKSATLQQTKKELPELIKKAGRHKRDVEVIVLNGFTMNQPQEVYTRLLDTIQRRKTGIPARKAGEMLSEIFQSSTRNQNQRYIVVVDEIDGLLQKSQRVLYTLFTWPMKPRSNLILLGIANSFNITDRFLPNLESRKCKPETLVFKPYSRDHLKSIIEQRLLPFVEDQNDPYGPFFDEVAINRLVQKIGSLSGDVRRTLELARTSLNALLLDSSLTKVNFPVMNKVLREHFESPFTKIIADTPFFGQALVVTSCLFFARRSLAKFAQLRAFYYHMAKEQSIPSVTTTEEFHEIFQNLVAIGILRPVGKKKSTAKSRKVGFNESTQFEFAVQKDAVEYAVESHPVLTNLLSSNPNIPNKILLTN